MKIRDLWRWSGEIARGPFLVWAALLFALKYNLDRVVLKLVFDRDWSVFNYFDRPILLLDASPAKAPAEYALLLAMALPFLWVGVALCVKRLRSAKLPLWLAVLFVVPIVKAFLFLVLAVAPERDEETKNDVAEERRNRFWERWFPKSTFGSAVLAVASTTLLAVGAMALGTRVWGEYGWGMFVGVPFCMGFFSVLIHGARQRRRLAESLSVATMSVSIAGATLLLIAFEGLVCLLMAAPLALALAMIGALAGHVIQAGRWRGVPRQLYCVPVLAVPLMLSTERVCEGPAPLLQVTSAVEIDAPPERVWQNVVRFAELPPPTEALFEVGIAYPMRAEIRGHGVGAVRHCVFSTGAFVEPISTWEEPRLLRFSVTQNPSPLQEWTPYHEIYPRHLHGFLVSRQGQFLLEPLPGGRTRLVGTTWYQHTMWPVGNWQFWSDHIIHAIHLRVLNHVKHLSEQEHSTTVTHE